MTERDILDRIAYLRTERGISERQLSFDCDHSAAYLSNLNATNRLPTLRDLTSICENLGITLYDFFKGIEQQNDDVEFIVARLRYPSKIREIRRTYVNFYIH